MSLPSPSSEQLAIFVFGPGTGELIAVRAPENEWLVVDGCGPALRPDVLQLLGHYEARPNYVVLTHPHLDHAMGLAKAIEAWTPEGERDHWPILGMVSPPGLGSDPPIDDPKGTLQRGVTQRAIAAIHDRWDRHPPCRWEMQFGDERQLGAVEIAVLAPESDEVQAALAAYRKKVPFDENRLSTVLCLDWCGHRIVLGSDLVAGWPAVRAREPQLNAHLVLKVPHHGSRTALHRELLDQAQLTRSWIVTPFASQRLPRFDDDGGVAFMHTIEKEVLLTSLPRARAAQGGAGGSAVLRTRLEVGASTWTGDPPALDFPSCFVALLVSKDGSVQPHFGPASLRVVA